MTMDSSVDSPALSRATRAWLGAALTLALLLRLGLLVLAIQNPQRMLETDSGSYLMPARALLETGYYSYPGGLRMPLYPALLALLQAAFGENLVVAVVVQVLLGLGTIYLTYRTALLLDLGRAAAILAAVLLSLSLESLISPYLILADTLFAFLIIASVYALIRFLRQGRPIWLVSAGLLTGCVIYTRPVTVVFASISVAALLLFNRRATMWKRVLHAGVYLALLFVLFQLPWSLRNQAEVGVRTITTELDLYYLWGAATIQADLQGIHVNKARAALDEVVAQTLASRGLPPTDANIYHVRIEVSKPILYEHFGRFVWLTLRYDLRNLLPGVGYAVKYMGLAAGDAQGADILRTEGLPGLIARYFGGQTLASLIFLPFIALLGLTYLGALLGVIERIRRRDWLTLTVLLLTAGFLMLTPGYSANSRYRVPAMPFLVMLAGTGLLWGWGLLREWWGRRASKRRAA